MAELTVPQINFAPLGDLGNVYKQAQADALRQQTLAKLGQGTSADDATTMLRSGDLQLAQLGVSLRNHNDEVMHQAQRDQVGDQHWSADYGLRQRTADRQDQTPLEKMNERLDVLKANGIDRNSPEGKAYLISGEWTGPGAGGASLNPIYGTGPDGKPAIIQTTKTGQAIQTQLPNGFQIAREPIKVDAGDHFVLLDPQTRQPVGSIPKNIAAAEAEKEVGSAQGLAQVNLPTVMDTSKQILKTIDEVKNHPGKAYALGMYSKLPTIPNTSQADFRAKASQLTGQAFLQAYQTLRGSGAITDIEGAKGTAALAALDQAQTTAAYDKALDDFKDVVKTGMLRAEAKARGFGLTPAAPESSKPVVIDGYTIKEH